LNTKENIKERRHPAGNAKDTEKRRHPAESAGETEKKLVNDKK